MNIKIFALMLCVMPGVAYSASRSAAVDGGGARASRARGSGIVMTMNTSGAVVTAGNGAASSHATSTVSSATSGAARGDDSTNAVGAPSAACRDAYRQCMDEFCLQDESDGKRCICSNNYSAAQKLLNEIKTIQAEADRLSTVEAQKARLGAKAAKVMGQDDESGSDDNLVDRIYGKSNNVGLADDESAGEDLFYMASDACASALAACGDRADMEETLYQRLITSDCKEYNSYLNDQKTYAEQNKSAAKLEVAAARLEVFDQTDKYNRGECLLAYKACIADKGGCGVHFENCYEEDGTALLDRRANACENILDQCQSARDYVKEDWNAEKLTIKAEAKKYTEDTFATSCLSKINMCLEDNCSYETNSACLTSIEIAKTVCPIITECDKLVAENVSKTSGRKTTKKYDGNSYVMQSVQKKLTALKRSSCDTDVAACLKEKCGVDFTGPQCLGKSQRAITELCPQDYFATCDSLSADDYNVTLSSILLKLDYQQTQGCINYFSEQLGAVCGMDMNCLPSSTVVASLATSPDASEIEAIQDGVIEETQNAVNEFFKRFEKDKTIAACQTAERPDGVIGESGLGTQVFNITKEIAQISAQNRALRELDAKLAELSRQESVEKAEKNCYDRYKVETKPKNEKNYSYIVSVSFEPSLRNCHVVRRQQVCETGGEKKATSALKAAAGGLSAGAAMGTQINAGWGTAIGGIVGAVGAGALGAMSGGQETFCQEVDSPEDINM